MAILANFPMVSQLTPITSDGRPSENSQFDCVAASIAACILWYEGKTQWDSTINPDRLKDAAYSEALHNSGTAATAYVAFCQSLGYKLSSVSFGNYGDAVKAAHGYINQNIPVIFTEDDPYADASLGWTHVCVWYGDDASGLTALDPYIAKPIYRSDASWANLLRSDQIWIVEKEEIQIVIEYNTPGIKPYYTETDPQHWTCLQTGKIVQFAILDAYKRYGNSGLCGLTFLGLPLSNEIAIEHIQPKDNPTKYAHLAGNGIVVQAFERGDLVYDPKHLLDSVPDMSGSVYPAHVNDGVGLDALIAVGKVPTATGVDPVKVKDRLTAIGLASHNNDAAIQSLVSQAIV